ncbi:MAG: glycosyltransferase family 4 protein [Thermoplasmatales archaeon]|nr:glycosyltransferase family 4 protein [Thermoplasmatales archaeon]
MRIGIDCHFESKIRQGTHTYISELVDAISRTDKQNDYFLLNADYNGSEYSQQSKKIIKKSIASNSTRKNVLYGYRKIVIENRLDILHTNYVAPFWVPCKRLVTMHDILYLSHRRFFPAFHRVQLSILTPFTLRSADKIITVSEYTKDEIVSNFGIDPSKIAVTLEAASTDFVRINVKDREDVVKQIMGKYRIQNDFVFFVGRFAPIKNISRMLRVVSEYNKEAKSKVSFVLAGDHDPVYPDTQISRHMEMFKRENQLVVLKNLPKKDLVQLYNAAKTLFFVTYGEGFGLPILEAMSCGLPVVTSNVTSCPEVAGDAAILVNPSDDREIFDALTAVLKNDGLRKKMIDKGLKRASLFSWDKCAVQTIKTYQSLFTSEDSKKLL